jgi:hypothetical protein
LVVGSGGRRSAMGAAARCVIQASGVGTADNTSVLLRTAERERERVVLTTPRCGGIAPRGGLSGGDAELGARCGEVAQGLTRLTADKGGREPTGRTGISKAHGLCIADSVWRLFFSFLFSFS